MADPVLTIRTHASPTESWTGSLVWTDGEGGSVEKGADSAALQFRVYNDYGGTLASNDALNVRLTTVDADTGNGFSQQTEEPVQHHWLHVKLISNNGTPVSGTIQVVGSIDGTIADDGMGKAIFHEEAGHQTIASDAYLAFESFIRVPLGATDGTHSFAIRIEYDYI